jgi:FMN phosphatase YigB (HAD superfamily)
MVAIDPARPLVICDADEVLLQFLVGLENYLERQGCYLDLASYRIHGNVKHRANGEPVADELVSAHLKGFFAAETRHLSMVPGAAGALNRLSDRAQIVILSNLPETSREARIENLGGHGMRFPVIAGKGPKGEIVREMIKDHRRNVVFIDDLPPHIASVAAETPHVHRLHFVADPRLARLVPKASEAHQRLDTWPEAEKWIAEVVEG